MIRDADEEESPGYVYVTDVFYVTFDRCCDYCDQFIHDFEQAFERKFTGTHSWRGHSFVGDIAKHLHKKALERWLKVRKWVKAYLVVMHWVHVTNMPGGAGYKAGLVEEWVAT